MSGRSLWRTLVTPSTPLITGVLRLPTHLKCQPTVMMKLSSVPSMKHMQPSHHIKALHSWDHMTISRKSCLAHLLSNNTSSILLHFQITNALITKLTPITTTIRMPCNHIRIRNLHRSLCCHHNGTPTTQHICTAVLYRYQPSTLLHLPISTTIVLVHSHPPILSLTSLHQRPQLRLNAAFHCPTTTPPKPQPTSRHSRTCMAPRASQSHHCKPCVSLSVTRTMRLSPSQRRSAKPKTSSKSASSISSISLITGRAARSYLMG